jgi:hypothetical protein
VSAEPPSRAAPAGGRDFERLLAHTGLNQLSWNVSGAFSAVFLLHQGLSVAAIYLCFALILCLRFVLRPLVVLTAQKIGLRATTIFASVLFAVQAPLLAFVHGPDIALLVYCAATALAQVYYWGCYHAVFAAAGDAARRGAQVGWRQMLTAVVGVLGPAAGGASLTLGGAELTFSVGAAIQLLSIIPLVGLAYPPFARRAPKGAYRAAERGAGLFVADAWIFASSNWAWGLIMFQAVGAGYAAYGGAMSAAALAGALGGLFFSRLIDTGRTRRVAWINAATLAAMLAAKGACGDAAVPVLAVAIGSALFGGLYTPSLMSAVYNESKSSPCPLRFQLAIEASWDVGGLAVCLVAAAISAAGAPLQAIVLIALPAVPVQAALLVRSYASRGGNGVTSGTPGNRSSNDRPARPGR